MVTIVTSKDNLVHWNTLFVGLGVFAVAFVCQHSAFFVADSLERPTVQRWSMVSMWTMLLSGALTVLCGVGGYLAFGENVPGNVLRALDQDSWITKAASAVLGFHMMLVYPIESFVARHICMRFQRTIASSWFGHVPPTTPPSPREYAAWAVVIYYASIIPAIMANDVGLVLSIVGTVTASSLAYFGPGMLYLGCHGEAFLSMFAGGQATEGYDAESQPLLRSVVPNNNNNNMGPISPPSGFLGCICWYLSGMPVWCFIAETGALQLRASGTEVSYTGLNGMIRPTMREFVLAIRFILFGIVALVAGLVSVLV